MAAKGAPRTNSKGRAAGKAATNGKARAVSKARAVARTRARSASPNGRPSGRPLWGGETDKAVRNFPISGETVPVAVIHWLARIKGAAAAVNGELGLLSKRSASRIAKAAAEIADGKHDSQFPIDVFQTGSGTSTNMNANEVIGKLAGE